MNCFKKHTLGLAAGLLLFACLFIPYNGNAQGKCLMVSDIHFNPFLSNDGSYTLDQKLAGILSPLKKYSEWKNAFYKYVGEHPAKGNILSGHDSNYALLKDVFDHMSDTIHPKFIVIAGDFLWHENERDANGNKYKNPSSVTMKEFTMQFIADMFHQKFPGVPIIPALGNNDSDAGDYYRQGRGFLDKFASAWQLKDKIDIDLFYKEGYYTYKTKNCPAFVVLNTTLLSDSTNRWDEKKPVNYKEGGTMLEHMKKDIAANGDNVWVLMHMPPGKDGYKIYQDKEEHKANPDTELWKPAYSNTFGKIIKNNKTHIKFMVAGHTHFNEFRVLYSNTDKQQFAGIRIIPSASTQHINNPSFEVAEFDDKYNVITEDVFYRNIAIDTTWKKLDAVAELQPKAANDLYHYLNSVLMQKALQGSYLSFYSVVPTNKTDTLKKADEYLLKADMMPVPYISTSVARNKKD